MPTLLTKRKAASGLLRGDAAVHSYADSLRALSEIPVGNWGGPTAMEINLRRLEWFEEGEDVNGQFLPIELGDMFRIGDNANKSFVLVAQPCDLMVRQAGREAGKRHHTVTHGVLLEATPFPPAQEGCMETDHGFGFNLEFYQPNTDWRIDLRKVHYINLDALARRT